MGGEDEEVKQVFLSRRMNVCFLLCYWLILLETCDGNIPKQLRNEAKFPHWGADFSHKSYDVHSAKLNFRET